MNAEIGDRISSDDVWSTCWRGWCSSCWTQHNVSNLGLHTNHEVAKCIMSAKGDNTSFPSSFQPFGKHLKLSSHDSSAFSNMSKRPTCSSEHSVLPLLTWSWQRGILQSSPSPNTGYIPIRTRILHQWSADGCWRASWPQTLRTGSMHCIDARWRWELRNLHAMSTDRYSKGSDWL